jgi:hypothetical protein
MIDFVFQGKRPLRREITSERLNDILRELRRIRPIAGRGINVDETGGGSRISVVDDAANNVEGVELETHPFQIISEPVIDSEQVELSIRPGTINNVLPSGLIGSNGALAKTVVEKNSLNYAVLNVNSDGKQIISASVEFSSSYTGGGQTPIAFGLPTSLKVLLGAAYGLKTFQVITDSITVTAKQLLIEPKQSSAPGELPYNIYYI